MRDVVGRASAVELRPVIVGERLEPGPSDPLFFDPDADTPKEISEEVLHNEMLKALAAAGVDPAVVYAFNKTGLLVSEENMHLLGAEELAEWEQAVEEAKQMFRINKA